MAVDTTDTHPGTDLDAGAAAPRAPHPLDPLSVAEVTAAAQVLRANGHVSPSLRFVMTSLHEPPKPPGLSFEGSPVPDRRAFVVTWDGAQKVLHEAVVSLTGSSVLSWTAVPGRFPGHIGGQTAAVEDAVRRDERWRSAVRARGVDDLDLTMIDPWPAGWYGEDDAFGVSPRVARALTWVRAAPDEHGYARPVEGVIATVDLDTFAVLDVEDHGVVALPAHPGNYTPEGITDPRNRPSFPGPRTDLKPIEITQPEGPSFTVDGWGVRWQKWGLRIGFNAREGLVLHQVTYTDGERERPVLWRASLSEMVVPYGDAAPTHWNKNVFDMGEVGMGVCANSLTLGCDCLGEIVYLDGVVTDEHGVGQTITNAVCLHEEDAGIAWKHTDFRTGHVEVRRSRRLVISTIATVGNYEYGFYWYLSTDGSIEHEVKLTGVLTTGAVAVGEQPRHGVLVAPGLYGPNHQHFFAYRLDVAVDGERNTVHEVDSVPEPDPARDPHRNAWIARATPVEVEGARDHEPTTGRYWKVTNPSSVNELGQERGYELLPGKPVPCMVREGSAIHDRARFVQHALWVTRNEEAERYAAGDYPWQTRDVQGLPEYVADAAPVVDEDVVLWYTVGAHHVARPEDWPVMPVASVGFHLKPVGFFDGNPALDVPPTTVGGCHGG